MYGLSNQRLHQIHGATTRMLEVSAVDVLAGAGRNVEIVGPVLEEEAAKIHTSLA